MHLHAVRHWILSPGCLLFHHTGIRVNTTHIGGFRWLGPGVAALFNVHLVAHGVLATHDVLLMRQTYTLVLCAMAPR